MTESSLLLLVGRGYIWPNRRAFTLSLFGQSQGLVPSHCGRTKLDEHIGAKCIVGQALEKQKVGFARSSFQPQPMHDEIQQYRHWNGTHGDEETELSHASQ